MAHHFKNFANTSNVVDNIVKQIASNARKEFQLRQNITNNMSSYSCSKVAVSINQLTTSVFNNPETNNKIMQQTDPICLGVDNMMPLMVQVNVIQGEKSKSNATSRIIDSHRTNKTNLSKNKKFIRNQSHQKVTQIQQIVKEIDQNKYKKSTKERFQPLNYKFEERQDEIVQKFRQEKIEEQYQKENQLKKKKSSFKKIDRNSLLSFDYDGKHIKIQTKQKSHLVSVSTDARPNRASITQIKTRQIPILKVKNCKTIKNQEQMNSTYHRVRPKRSDKVQQIIEQPKYINYQQKNYTDPSVWMMDSPINSGNKIKFQKRTFDNSQRKYSIKDIKENIKSRRLSKQQYKELKSLQKKYSQKKQKYVRLLKTSQSEPIINYDIKTQKNFKQNKGQTKKCYDFKPISTINKSQKIIVNSFILKNQLTEAQPQTNQKEKNLRSKIQNSQIQLGIQSKLSQVQKIRSYTENKKSSGYIQNNDKLLNLTNKKIKIQSKSEMQNVVNMLRKQSAKLHNNPKVKPIFISSKNTKMMLMNLQKRKQIQNKS